MRKVKFLWIIGVVFLSSCVTVNIYFPAQEAQKKAAAIVNAIRGNQDNSTKKELSKPQSFNMDITIIPQAYAENALNVTNAKIQAIKQSMKKRFIVMKPFYEKGYIAELLNGYLKIYRQPSSLKDKLTLNRLVKEENSDRHELYKEVAKALNIQPSQIYKLQRIFAKQWQDTSPKGTYLQTKTGWIRK